MSTATQIDLTQFTTDGSREVFRTPFVLNGWRYATDGRIAVRVPTDELSETDKNKVVPTIPEVFALPDFTPMPWPQMQMVKGGYYCLYCAGKGRINGRKCETCRGEGAMECSKCGHENECRECDGIGILGGTLCPDCRGKSDADHDHYRFIGALAVRDDFDRKIHALPNVRWAGNDGDKVHFLFDGGEGVVMKFNVPGE